MSNPLADIQRLLIDLDPMQGLTKRLGYRPCGIAANLSVYYQLKSEENKANVNLPYNFDTYQQKLMGLPVLLFDWMPKGVLFVDDRNWLVLQGLDRHNSLKLRLYQRLRERAAELKVKLTPTKQRDLVRRIQWLNERLKEETEFVQMLESYWIEKTEQAKSA